MDVVHACGIKPQSVTLIGGGARSEYWRQMLADISGQLVVIFIGDITMDVSVPVSELIIGVVVSLILSGIYTFFVFAVDYSRTEYVQFEDDDYYYYVKAVPKMTVSTPDVKVQKINARKLQRPQR